MEAGPHPRTHISVPKVDNPVLATDVADATNDFFQTLPKPDTTTNRQCKNYTLGLLFTFYICITCTVYKGLSDLGSFTL